MEMPDYRDNLRGLLEFNDGKHLMKPNKVAAYLGVSQKTVKRNYNVGAYGITCESLARMLCTGAGGAQ